jgi:hypothetical protein
MPCRPVNINNSLKRSASIFSVNKLKHAMALWNFEETDSLWMISNIWGQTEMITGEEGLAMKFIYIVTENVSWCECGGFYSIRQFRDGLNGN